MTQIIRLTELDLTKLVKRILSEEVKKNTFDKGEYGYDGPYSRKDKSEIIKVIKNTKEQLEQAKYEVDRLERQLTGYQKMRNSWTKRGEE
jgi:exonuclease I